MANYKPQKNKAKQGSEGKALHCPILPPSLTAQLPTHATHSVGSLLSFRTDRCNISLRLCWRCSDSVMIVVVVAVMIAVALAAVAAVDY